MAGETMTPGFDEFCKLRWPDCNGQPVCPRCGDTRYYKLKTRALIFRCIQCCCSYSPTTGTPFSGRKMSFENLCAGIAAFNDGERNGLRMARRLGVNSRTGYMLVRLLTTTGGCVVRQPAIAKERAHV